MEQQIWKQTPVYLPPGPVAEAGLQIHFNKLQTVRGKDK